MTEITIKDIKSQEIIKEAIEYKKQLLIDQIREMDSEISAIELIISTIDSALVDTGKSYSETIDLFSEIDRFDYKNLRKSTLGKSSYYRDGDNTAIFRQGINGVVVWVSWKQIEKMKKMDEYKLKDYISSQPTKKTQIIKNFINDLKDADEGFINMLNTQTKPHPEEKVEGELV